MITDIVNEIKKERLEAFKKDEIDTKDYCKDCKHEADCEILMYVNKLYKIRLIKQGKPAKTANSDYGCTIFDPK